MARNRRVCSASATSGAPAAALSALCSPRQGKQVPTRTRVPFRAAPRSRRALSAATARAQLATTYTHAAPPSAAPRRPRGSAPWPRAARARLRRSASRPARRRARTRPPRWPPWSARRPAGCECSPSTPWPPPGGASGARGRSRLWREERAQQRAFFQPQPARGLRAACEQTPRARQRSHTLLHPAAPRALRGPGKRQSSPPKKEEGESVCSLLLACCASARAPPLLLRRGRCHGGRCEGAEGRREGRGGRYACNPRRGPVTERVCKCNARGGPCARARMARAAALPRSRRRGASWCPSRRPRAACSCLAAWRSRWRRCWRWRCPSCCAASSTT